MKKSGTIILIAALLSFSFSLSAQSSRSKSKSISFSSEEVKSVYMLPYIEPTVYFKDANHNNVLDANEKAEVLIVLKNSGGRSELVEVSVVPQTNNPHVKFGSSQSAFSMEAGDERTCSFPLQSDINLATDSIKFSIAITEKMGYDTKATLQIYTEEYPAPKMMLRGVTIIDGGIGTKALANNPDGMVQAGETVWAKVSLQNVGFGATDGLSYSISSGNSNVILLNDEGPCNTISGSLDNLKSGKSTEIEFRFSPNNRYKSDGGYIPLTLSVNEGSGFGNLREKLPIELGVAPQQLKNFDIKPKANSRSKAAVVIFDSQDNMSEGSTIRNIMMAPAGVPLHKNAVAVVIGAEENKYSVSALYASHDAEVFAEYLRKTMGISNSNILMLSNEEATFSNMRDIFNPTYGKLRSLVRPEETDVFIFYSGHGIPFKSDDGHQLAYLLPYDARKEDICNTGYSLERLCTELNSLRAKSVTMIVDACFSGTSRASETRSVQNIANTKGVALNMDAIAGSWTSNPKFRMFTSCSEDETSLSYDKSQSGLFTYYLALGMQGEADGSESGMKDGSITLSELYSYVYKNVTEESRKVRGSVQTPHLYGDGSFLMEKYK